MRSWSILSGRIGAPGGFGFVGVERGGGSGGGMRPEVGKGTFGRIALRTPLRMQHA